VNPETTEPWLRLALLGAQLIVAFGFVWGAGFVYRRALGRIDLAELMFKRDNVAVSVAVVGFYLGTIFGLRGTFDSETTGWSETLGTFAVSGVLIVLLMGLGAWVFQKVLAPRLGGRPAVEASGNVGAALVEAGFHVANGLILGPALLGDSGGWAVGLVTWAVGVAVVVAAALAYPRLARYAVFTEINDRRNVAAGMATAGLLVGVGNTAGAAFGAEFVDWGSSLTHYGVGLVAALMGVASLRWLTDLLLVPGVRLSAEIAGQRIPNVGAGLIEGFAYVAASLLVSPLL
jgi:uncharacterized membrane protein YjfL (UPF0719 family)